METIAGIIQVTGSEIDVAVKGKYDSYPDLNLYHRKIVISFVVSVLVVIIIPIDHKSTRQKKIKNRKD
jgi:hypothetical protein